LVNLSTNEDAGVYKISPDLALVQTLDFFTPIVDDPYTFGAISAANSLSDVYAMGGKPLTAMNIVCFPEDVPLEILGQILKGGADKVKESGAAMVGGHSVKDKEPKFGLSVTGIIHPDKIMTNCNLKANDILILTKPLGTGILTTALKRKLTTESKIKNCINGMLTLNKTASELMQGIGANSCTDITGFGFLGHLKEMCTGSKLGAHIFLENFKYYDQALAYAGEGVVPKGCKDNLQEAGSFVNFSEDIPLAKKYLLADPQTSGGLLISISPERAKDLLSLLKSRKVPAFITGKVVPENKITIF
jgi:selenide,water dikinase